MWMLRQPACIPGDSLVGKHNRIHCFVTLKCNWIQRLIRDWKNTGGNGINEMNCWLFLYFLARDRLKILNIFRTELHCSLFVIGLNPSWLVTAFLPNIFHHIDTVYPSKSMNDFRETLQQRMTGLQMLTKWTAYVILPSHYNMMDPITYLFE